MKLKIVEEANAMEPRLRLRDHCRECPACRSYLKGRRHSFCHEGNLLMRRMRGEDA